MTDLLDVTTMQDDADGFQRQTTRRHRATAVDWSRLGNLRHDMTSTQAMAMVVAIGKSRPERVAVHDCGIASYTLSGKVVYFDEYGETGEDNALERIRLHEARPKRGRPRKKKAK